ncbi:cytochrome P450 10-like isoform X1 [Haliotis asinina]|uniref:cytochrome P450 10-like isoform X1 n=2 Tax=Haliotis asinina TaxID=109174 RepID=UPI003531FE60
MQQCPRFLRAGARAKGQMELMAGKSSASVPSLIDAAHIQPFEDMPTPSGPRSWPVIGALFNFKPFTDYTGVTIHRLLGQLHDELGETFRIRLGKWYVCTADPEAMETIIRHEEKYPIRPSLDLYETYVKRENRPVNLGVLNGKEWWQLRKRVQKKLLPPRSALHYLPVQNKVADEFISLLKSKPLSAHELRETYFRFAVEAISVVVFNKRMGFLSQDTIPQDCEEYLTAVKEFFAVFNTFIGKAPLYRFFRTPMYMRMKRAADKAYEFSSKAATEAIQRGLELEKSGKWDPGEANFILSLFASGSQSVDEISAVMQDLMVGGTDSTAKNLEFFLYALASSPEVQDKLHAEVMREVGPTAPLTEEALSNMPYLKACLKEGFRMRYPVPTGTARILQNGLNLNGYYIPKDTIIIMNNPRLLKNPEYVKDPEKYIPERWLRNHTGQLTNNIPGVGLLPFSFGPRKCVGQRFAEQELNLAAVKVLQNFKISLPEGFEEPDIIYEVFGTFSKPIPFIFTPREDVDS